MYALLTKIRELGIIRYQKQREAVMKAYKPKTSNSSISYRYALMSLCLSSICHAVILDHLKNDVSYDRMSMLIILFNILSVGMMSIISVFADKVENKHTGVRLSVLLTVLGYFIPANFGIDLKVTLLALGSATFYSFASSSLLSRSNGKSRDIGLLIGGSGVGIAFASFAGFFGHLFAPILMILAIPADRYQKRAESDSEMPIKEQKTSRNVPFSPLSFVLLFLSYLLLSYEFSSLSFSWNFWFKTQFELLLAIGLGRAVGGYVSDLLGRVITVAISACGGTLLLCFCADDKRRSLLGLFLLSISLAPILTAVTRMMPSRPAFAFALMSGAAYLGQVLKNLIGFKNISMLLICIVLIAVTVASELPFLPKAESEETEHEDT